MYTQLSNEEIAEHLQAAYGLGPLGFAVGIAQGVENSNYLVAIGSDVQETKYILTLYEKRVAAGDVPYFLDLMQHLARAGLNCPQPIARTDGALVSTLARRQAALVTFLHGKSRSVIKNPHAAAVGGALAALHVAGADFAPMRANTLSLEGWQALAKKIEGKLDGIQPGLDKLVGDELAYLGTHWPSDLPRATIHADLFPDNVFFEGDVVSGLIDFYFACTDMLAYDLAITINAWCFEGREFNMTKCALMVKNYQQKRVLSDAEKVALPVLLRGAALRFLLTRAYDLLHHEKSALVTPKDPLEYVAKLRFHQNARDASAYGI